VREVIFAGDRLIATVSRRNNDVDVRLWTIPEGRETLHITAPKGMLNFVVSDDGSYLIGYMDFASNDPALVWDLASGKQVAALSVGSGGVLSAATHKDILALGEQHEAMVSLWRLGSWAPLGQIHGIQDRAEACPRPSRSAAGDQRVSRGVRSASGCAGHRGPNARQRVERSARTAAFAAWPSAQTVIARWRRR
jgi:hypothetical protein